MTAGTEMTNEILQLLLEIRRGVESEWPPRCVGWESIANRIDALLARPPGGWLDPLDVARKCWEEVQHGDPQMATQLLRTEIERHPRLLEKALELAAREWLYKIGMPPRTTNFPESFTADSSRT